MTPMRDSASPQGCCGRSLIVALTLSGIAAAAETPTGAAAAASDDADMEVVLVTGTQPGPGLWKVTSGPNVMWVLGEVSPFARKVRWNSRKFDRLLQDSQELLIDYSGFWGLTRDEKREYLKAEQLPRGSTLGKHVSPELYARVQETAEMYAAPGIDEVYPFAATNRLVTNAMIELDLIGFSARFAAGALGEKRGIKITNFAAPEYPFEDRLKLWQQPANVVCLERAVSALEDGGDGAKLLSNAWALGDVEALRRLVPQFSFSRDGFRQGPCAAAMRGGEQQARDYDAERIQGWLKEAERCLRENHSTMAVVLMSELFAPDGYLAALRAKGYEIVEPR
jgi:hypothetical protein